MAQKVNFELPKNADGSLNPKYVDLLDEDKPISGQNFACISFVSPEKILKQKQFFLFEQFLRVWDFTKSADKFRQFLSFTSHKYNINLDMLFEDFNGFCDEERSYLSESTIEDDYKTFLDANEETLEEKFNKEHAFQTSVRSIKVRGVFATQDEAELRCKMLREVDPNHDVYVGPVGMWMPWDPEAYKTGRVEYLEPELNKLMAEKMKNDKKAKEEFEKRLKETKKKAIEENIKKAQESGNKLSQNVDKDGNLYDVNVGLNEDMSSVADISKEIFENENVIPANTDKGAAAILAKAPKGFTPSVGSQETASATIFEEETSTTENVVISQDDNVVESTDSVEKLD